MVQNKIQQNKKTSPLKQTNTIETLKDFGQGFGAVDQFFGNFDDSEQPFGYESFKKEQKAVPKTRQEFSIFNYRNYYERELVKKQIKELTEQVRKEIGLLKKADTALAADIKDIEKLTIESLPAKPGVYHIRFLEIILRLIKTLREKIGESRTWLAAMVSRKKKRGSLFLALSKKKGTQYSLSQELTSARSVQ